MEYNGLLLDLINNGKEYKVVGVNFNFNKLKFLLKKTDVTVPSECNGIPITVIGEGAFQRSYITGVELPDTVKEIEDDAFCDCSSLTKITFGNGLKRIGDRAFKGCSSLRKVSIPNGVEYITDETFMNCSSLESLCIGLQSINESAFIGCSRLAEISVDKENSSYKVIGGNVYCNGGRTLCLYAKGNPAETFEVPEGVEEISYYAFEGSENLKHIRLADSVSMIGGGAFDNCGNLQYTVEGNLKYLGNEGNRYLCAVGVVLKAVGDVVFNDNCRFVATDVFEDCDGLRYTVDGNLKYLGSASNPYFYLAGTEDEGIASAEINDNCIIIGQDALSQCSGLTHVSIGKRVNFIGDFAFYCSDTLESVSIPDSVGYVGQCAFCFCYGLKQLVIGNSVKFIGNDAFSCSNIESVKIPNGITVISENAFSGCDSLAEVTLPASVKVIDRRSFDTGSLKTINFEGTVKEWEAVERGCCWISDDSDCTVVCADGQLKAIED